MTGEKLSKIAEEIVALRRLTSESGFFTTRTQRSLLEPLSDSELTTVALAIRQLERMNRTGTKDDQHARSR